MSVYPLYDSFSSHFLFPFLVFLPFIILVLIDVQKLNTATRLKISQQAAIIVSLLGCVHPLMWLCPCVIVHSLMQTTLLYALCVYSATTD